MRVFGDKERAGERGIGQRGHAFARNQRGHGSAIERRDNKVVAVVPLSANGEEQIAGCSSARVDGEAG